MRLCRRLARAGWEKCIAGTPHLLFRGGNYVMLQSYDAAPDGQRFLMIKEKEAPASSKELNIIVNWADELKRRAPVAKK